ncbi:hypothetical protein Tco_1523177 [Tanacetum coccineum]
MLGSELQGEDFAKRMVDLVNQRKKFFAEERAKAKRNKPMIQSQSQEGIFISQDKYVAEILKKFDFVRIQQRWLPISWKGRLISWRVAKKQTIVATSTTEAEYVAAASCCGQVLWLQNQLLDYGFNFMNTIIHIDNQSTICIIKNPVYHSKTKHIEIRHHFISGML